MPQEYFNSGGIQTYTNPMTPNYDGQLIHSVNMISQPLGAKTKRPGYSTFLGTADGSAVNSLFAFPNIGDDETKLNLYRASGSSLYHSLQGTGAWTLSGNGTISPGAHFGAAIGNGGTVLIGGDGVGSTRHTTNGTSFTNTTLAPIAPFFVDYQNAMYAAGTVSYLFKSTDNDATNWNTTGTANSTSFRIPGEGKLQKIFVAGDQLIAPKTKGNMYSWDGYNINNLSTKYGPSSPYSIGETEDYRMFVNQYGHYGFDRSNNIQLLSNAVQRYFYNKQNTGIAGTAFASIPGKCHIYDYYAAIGSVTDDFTQRPISNAILNYNYQKNEYLMWQFANNPTEFLSYTDTTGKRQLIFGDNGGQCYQLDPTITTDNGNVINTELVYLFTYAKEGMAMYEKKWNWIRLFFNPGCEVNVQYAFSNTFTYQHLQWRELVDNSANPKQNSDDGVCEYRFDQDARGRFLFIRLYEASPNSQWTYYGASVDAEPIIIR